MNSCDKCLSPECCDSDGALTDRIAELKQQLLTNKVAHSDSVAAVQRHFERQLSTAQAELAQAQHQLGLITIDRNHEKRLRESCEIALEDRQQQLSDALGERHCLWVNEDESSDYVSGCGKYFVLAPDADEPENWMQCCCFCGGKMTMQAAREKAK